MVHECEEVMCISKKTEIYDVVLDYEYRCQSLYSL